MWNRLRALMSRLAEAGQLPRGRIPDDVREQLPLDAIEKVVFYKLDECVTDLICCQVEANGQIRRFHEEEEGWSEFVAYLEELPGFEDDWFQSVALPPFETCETLAYLRTPDRLAPTSIAAQNDRMQLTSLLVPTLLNQLRALSGWLDKAEAFCAARGDDPDVLLSLRLALDMFPLTTQLRFLAFQAQEPVYRLRGDAVPEAILQVRQEGRDGADSPGTWAEARARVAEASRFLGAIAPDELDAAAAEPIAHDLPNGMIFDMTGEQYVRDWALPQVAFHQMVAYAILRQSGVPLGKVDYVPHMFAFLRPGTAPAA